MFKALVVLVVSMMAGALLLASIEPGIGLIARTSKPALLLHAYGQSGAPSQNLWTDIRVIRLPVDTGASLSDGPRNSQPEAHLVIDSQGIVESSTAWHDGNLIEGAGNALVIGLEVSADTSRVATAQLETLKLLLLRLGHELGLPANRIRLDS